MDILLKIYFARLDAFDRDKNMLFSGSGTGAGLSYSFGAILPYNGEGFDRVPATRSDSIEMARYDRELPIEIRKIVLIRYRINPKKIKQ